MDSFSNKSIDATKIQRWMVGTLLFSIVVVMATYTLKTGNLWYMAAFIILPFILILISHPQLAFVLAVVFMPAELIIFRNVDASFFLRILVCTTFLFGIVLGQKQWSGKALPEKKFFLLLLAVIVLLMAIRGTGIRALGSTTWGGMVYVEILAAIFFFFAVNGLKVSKRHIKWLIIGSLLAGLLGGIGKYVGLIVSEGGSYRQMWIEPIAWALLTAGFVVGFRRFRLLSWLLIALAVIAISLTGFRSELLGIIMIIGIYGLFKARNKIGYILLGLVCGLLLWGGIIAVSPMLSKTMQRAVSFLPGTAVDAKTALDAAGSIDWRVEIWGYAMERAGPYLLLGRGATFDVQYAVSQWGVEDVTSPWMAFQTHVYHSGPIELLVDYGIPGLIAVLGLHVLLFRRMWRLSVRLAKYDDPIHRYVSYLCAAQIWGAISFYVAFGFMVGFGSWLIQVAVIMVLANSLLDTEDQPLAISDRSE